MPNSNSQNSNNPGTPPGAARKSNNGSGRGAPPAQPAAAPVQQPAARTSPLARDKPALPVLSPENAAAYYAEPLPAFRDVPPSEKQLLLVKKLHLCSFTFDFTDQVSMSGRSAFADVV